MLAARAIDLLLLGMGGTIDKDYPRSTQGYAFEIDEVASERVLQSLPFFGLAFDARSLCKKDSTEITASDRAALLAAVRRWRAPGLRRLQRGILQPVCNGHVRHGRRLPELCRWLLPERHRPGQLLRVFLAAVRRRRAPGLRRL